MSAEQAGDLKWDQLNQMSSRDATVLVELVNRCLAGDAVAWQEIVDIARPVILGTCRRMRLSQEESLDVFGQICYLLLRHLERIQSPEKLLGYVSTMTRREVLALTRRRGMYTLLSEEELEPHAVENPDFDSKLEQEDERLLLTEAMLTLPVKEYKLIFALFLDESEPSYEQISQKLNMPVASIGPTRARILAKLQRRLRRKGFKF